MALKIALCLSGHLRTYEKTYESIYEQLYNKYEVDTFISTWKNLGNKKYAVDDPLPEGEIVDIEKVRKIYNPIQIVVDDPETEVVSNRIKKDFEGIKLGNGDKMSQLMIMLYKIWEVNSWKRYHEDKYNFKYDVVIRARFDVWLKYINMDLVKQKLYCTPGHLGVTDFVFAGPSLTIDALCDIFTVLTTEIPFNVFANIDQLWSTHLTNNNIPFEASWEGFDYLRYVANVGKFDSKGQKIGEI